MVAASGGSKVSWLLAVAATFASTFFSFSPTVSSGSRVESSTSAVRPFPAASFETVETLINFLMASHSPSIHGSTTSSKLKTNWKAKGESNYSTYICTMCNNPTDPNETISKMNELKSSTLLSALKFIQCVYTLKLFLHLPHSVICKPWLVESRCPQLSHPLVKHLAIVAEVGVVAVS